MDGGESSEERRQEESAEGSGNELPVAAMAAPCPRHRDLLIKGFVILFLVALGGGGYLLLKGAGSAMDSLRHDPVGFMSRLVSGEEVFKTCETFVRENEDLFEHLGKDVKLTLIREQVSVVNRTKKAKIVARARGETDSETVFFLLERRKGKWRVATAASRTRTGEYKTLYPQRDAPQKET